ncbi:MAG: Molybdopterin molybdenumtransferase [Pelotomaculum sp. PtaB.Bin013]|nr:MAG: Molybdopterin molybdenumtransferase [Pelotomaculum sp. PtaB.Bin013]
MERAIERYFAHLQEIGTLNPGPPELIPAEEALNRVTALPVYARNSSPHYHASAMDGFVVHSTSTYGASESTPVQLKVGEETVLVDTGDPVPAGFDAVIMIEDIHYVQPDLIEIIHPATPWQHVRAVGEDIIATEMIVPANHQVRPVDIGAFLAGGVNDIYVHPCPRVALLPTGTELVQPGSELLPGDIVEFNSRIFGAMAKQWGAVALRRDITADDFDSLKTVISSAVDEADIVIVNAGSSAGSEDYTADVIQSLGKVLVHGIATKPGKPVILGEIKGKPVIGVPGYPVSAYLVMELFVKPLVYRKLGLHPPDIKKVEATVSRKLVSPMGVEEFVRVKLGQVSDKIIATPVSRGAGILMSLVRADGMIRVPRLSEGYNGGDIALVELFRPLEEIKDTTVIIGSHDITLDVLANFLRLKYPSSSLSSAHVGSLGGLSAIKRGESHCAGIHLLDEETGDYNTTYVKKLLPGRDVVLVNLVYREQGLILAAGNPKNIRTLEDLAGNGISFVNRQRGSGTRILLDYHLSELGINDDNIHGYEHEEYTHMAVAAAVKAGAADAGLGIRAAAQALGLEFIGIAEERYDLCIPVEFMETPYIQRLLEVISLTEFKEEVVKLGGYDLRDCGKVMWHSNKARENLLLV